MAEVLPIAFGALVLVSLAAIVGYALVLLAVVVGTLLRARRRSPLSDELDAVLAEILGRPESHASTAVGTRWSSRRR